ncbi:MAG: nucleotidyltransferase domain-containing protein [Rhizobiales bacterium]|nr:nucleotidyltransferase domain-containing protein [Hyphomicrobiales bacterium]MBI3673410.1 nucleotidyltransferase domain-containing protein [Hyphomicrobiales bacterium]
MTKLDALVAASLAQVPPPEIAAMAEQVRQRHTGVAAVLAYGSCLRGVAATDSLIDLYVLTEDLSGVSANRLSRLGCAMVPPNVYHAEIEWDGRRYRAKYAVLPLDLFARRMTSSNPYFWARFAQPTALVQASGPAARAAVTAAIMQATRTLYGHALALNADPDPLARWTAGFAATYATELRAEASGSRARHLVEANADYYRQASAALADATPVPLAWPRVRLMGKLWSVARLVKAAFTFAGGADYIAWKIERHSGQKIELTQWQRRHPILAGIVLLPQLLRRGAVR